MTVDRCREELEADIFVEGDLEADFHSGYTSDLLSDVMGNAPEGSVLFTIQAHKNTVAVASLTGISAIVLCNGRKAPEDMREAAESEKITILGTSESQFIAGAKVAKALEIV